MDCLLLAFQEREQEGSSAGIDYMCRFFLDANGIISRALDDSCR